jgi:hypothetical protein
MDARDVQAFRKAARLAKAKIEGDLNIAIHKFQRDTGFRVRSVHLEQLDNTAMGDSSRSYIPQVTIELDPI